MKRAVDCVSPIVESISLSRRTLLQGAVATAVTISMTDESRAITADSVKDPPHSEESKIPVRIAVVQQDGNPGAVDLNRRKALEFAKLALARGAEVILFHEELLIGYVENPRELAEPANGETTQAFQKLLAGSNSLVIYGLTERNGNKLHIAAVVVSEHGIVANYHKAHLYPEPDGSLRNEPAFYTPGDQLVTFNLKGHLCGLMICFDGDFPEMTRAYADLGCSMLFWLNNRRSRGHEEVKTLAFSNSMIMATSCCTGKDEGGNICTGGSNITSASGELLAELWGSEGVITADVDPGQVRTMRKHNAFFTSRRPELYWRPLGKC